MDSSDLEDSAVAARDEPENRFRGERRLSSDWYRIDSYERDATFRWGKDHEHFEDLDMALRFAITVWDAHDESGKRMPTEIVANSIPVRSSMIVEQHHGRVVAVVDFLIPDCVREIEQLEMEMKWLTAYLQTNESYDPESSRILKEKEEKRRKAKESLEPLYAIITIVQTGESKTVERPEHVTSC